MKILKAKIHGFLDYVVVAGFAAAPLLLGLTGVPATLAYALALIHLVVTLVTKFPVSLVKLLPFSLHGWIELIVAPALMILPWLFGFSDIPDARNFYLGAGLVVFATWLLTDYHSA